jgi:two-component system sensor histidine kinase BaeS
VRDLTDTLTRRLVLLGVVTALISVLAVGLVAVPLVRSEAETRAAARLAEQADLIAGLALGLGVGGRERLDAQLNQLQATGVKATVVLGGEPAPLGIPASLVNEGFRDGTASGIEPDPPTLIEVRQLDFRRVLVLSTSATAAVNDVATPLLSRLAISLLVGLVLAVAAGALVARRLARPLNDTAEAARRLSTGERAVRVVPDGPVEVADVAEAINGLADALERSESRQRRFLLSVSHELRTPLTAVRGYAEALADGVVTGPDAVKAGAVIGSEAERLDRLMSDLLALARAEADDFVLDLVPLDLNDVARAAVEAWTEQARRAEAVLSAQTSAQPITAVVDPVRARQVVDALVSNALRVTPAGRPVVVAALVLADGRVALQVRDGGPGLTDDDLTVAFDQGVLRDRYEGVRPGGSGLGLALVERLSRRMGGSVTAEHAPEGGASFTVAFASVPAQ